MKKFCYLLCVEGDGNHNKYYEMTENDNQTFSVKFGRIGSKASLKTYNINQWQSKYNEKMRKGYTDVTHLKKKEITKVSSKFLEIKDEKVKSFIDKILQISNTFAKESYTVDINGVTQLQLDEAQRVINTIISSYERNDVTSFNKSLCELFVIIPRRIANVRNELLDSSKDKNLITKMKEIINREQDVLDNLKSQIVTIKTENSETNNSVNHTILDAFGLEVSQIEDDKIISRILKMMGQNKHQFVSAYSIKHKISHEKFINHLDSISDDEIKKCSLLWHGSRNENWWSIIQNGLILNPASAVKTGAMFGHGLYFADKAQKSIGYTSLTGSYWTKGKSKEAYISLFSVNVGKPLVLNKSESWQYSLNKTEITKRGFNSVAAMANDKFLRNNEFIIYDEKQCTIQFVIQIKEA